jgi:hypothetical protein
VVNNQHITLLSQQRATSNAPNEAWVKSCSLCKFNRVPKRAAHISDVVTSLIPKRKDMPPRVKWMNVFRGSVMDAPGSQASPLRSRVLNTVPLEKAVLCAECDVVSDSPHDVCMVCGSHSLFNIARVFGGKLPKKRVALVLKESVERPSREVILPFPKPHRPRRRATVASRQLAIAALGDNGSDEVDRGVLFGPKGR